MSSTSEKAILDGVRYFCVPLARLLLRSGVGFREFSEICKAAFVQVAAEDYGIRRRPTNLSRIAVMTGITRKEVSRLRKRKTSAPEVQGKLSPASSVLQGWFTDAKYLNSDGSPAELSIEGSGATFTGLMKSYAGDIPPGAMLKELSRVGAIETTKSGHIRPLSRYFISATTDEELFLSGAASIHNLLKTIAHNLAAGGRANRLLERYVWSSRLSQKQREEFRALAEAGAKELLEKLDDWVVHEEAGQAEPHEDKPIGLGVYYYDQGMQPAKKEPPEEGGQ